MKEYNLGRVVGESAYEIAVRNGFEGTEQEWLDQFDTSEIKESVDLLSGLVDEQSGDISNIKESLEDVSSEVKDVKDVQEDLNNRVSTIDESINELKDCCDTVKEDLQEAKNSIDDLVEFKDKVENSKFKIDDEGNLILVVGGGDEPNDNEEDHELYGKFLRKGVVNPDNGGTMPYKVYEKEGIRTAVYESGMLGNIDVGGLPMPGGQEAPRLANPYKLPLDIDHHQFNGKFEDDTLFGLFFLIGEPLSAEGVTLRENFTVHIEDTSNIKNMKYLFYGAGTKGSVMCDVSNWDTTSTTNMEFMFYSAAGTVEGFSNWNVSNVTNMSGMFAGYTGGLEFDFSKWDTSNANENIKNMPVIGNLITVVGNESLILTLGFDSFKTVKSREGLGLKDYRKFFATEDGSKLEIDYDTFLNYEIPESTNVIFNIKK